ncbi:protein kinase domain-containing protein [Streptomyces sp. XH2]|uniref:protein kinase domain-containing protein n=1 Tax=Streptomyces sp. XH2 TaxID=3412483 RepID=UPI003C7B7ED9
MLGAGLAEGLAAIHACGLVHRDLKPSNVIMSGDGPRIIDFGIARPVGASSLTSAGVVIGTFAFMSPEQVRADQAHAASDVFSLGAVLAYAATGRGPFDAGTIPAIVHRILNEAPELGEVPGALRNAIEACLAKDPDDRPDASGLLTMLGPATGRARPAEDSGVRTPGALSNPAAATAPTAPTAPTTPATPATVRAPQTATLPADPSASQGLSRRRILGLAGGALALVGGGLIAATRLGGKGHDDGRPPTPLTDVATARPLWQSRDIPTVSALTAHPGGVLCMGYEPEDSIRQRTALWNLGAKGTIAWHLPLPDLAVIRSRGVGAGAVDQGTFYFGGSGARYSSGSKKVPTQIVAVDLARGTQAWSAELDDPPRYVDSICGIKNGRLYATSTTTKWGPRPVLWAVDIASRRVAWRCETGYERKNLQRAASSTLIVPRSGDRVFHLASSHDTGQEARLQAFDAAHSYIEGWKNTLPEAPGNVSDQPNLCAADDALVYASTTLIGLDPESGDRLWTKEQPSGSYNGFGTPAAAADGSLVYVVSRAEDTATSGKRVTTLTVQALEPRSGKERWHSSVAAAIGSQEKPGLVDLLVDGSTLYVLVGQTVNLEYDEDSYIDGNNPVLHPFVWAVDAATGTSRWKYIPPGPFDVAAGYGRLYVSTRDGVVALPAEGTGT